MAKKQRCFTAYCRGGLKECLETEKPITCDTFDNLIKSGVYIFYGFDRRINAVRYILVDMDKNLGLPTYLHYYIPHLAKKLRRFENG